jgi:broad specificity phosphatase PhoE
MVVRGLRLYVLRHGEPERRDLLYGHHDLGLSPRGLEQARAQVSRLAEVPFAALYSSDLMRARIGAQLVAERCGLPLRLEPDLREMSMGALEGVEYAEALRLHPEQAGRSYLDMLDVRMPGGGESVRDLAQRVLACVERIAKAHAGPATAGRWPTVLVYAHNTVGRVLLARASGAGVAGYRAFLQRYGAMNRIDVPVRDDAHAPEGAERIDWGMASIGYSNRDPLAAVADVIAHVIDG